MRAHSSHYLSQINFLKKRNGSKLSPVHKIFVLIKLYLCILHQSAVWAMNESDIFSAGVGVFS